MARNADELTVEERGGMAKSLLENPIFTIALDEIDAEALRMSEESAWDAKEAREFLWQYRRALKQLRDRLNGYIQNAEWERINKIKNAESEVTAEETPLMDRHRP